MTSLRFVPRRPAPRHRVGLLPRIRHWILTILVDLDGQREFIRFHGFADDELAAALNLDDAEEAPFEAAQVKRLRRRLSTARLEDSPPVNAADLDPTLLTNIGTLAGHLGLDGIESELLAFALSVQVNRPLRSALAQIRCGHLPDFIRALAYVIGAPEDDVASRLGREASLIRAGLLVLRREPGISPEDRLDQRLPSFCERMTQSVCSLADLIGDVAATAPRSNLSADDFTHLRLPVDAIVRYLERGRAAGRRGMNVLLHGRPGTGKTELSRLIADQLGVVLRCVSATTEDGEPMSAEQRLQAWRLAQALLSGSTDLLAFDEAQDIFPSSPFHAAPSSGRKAWMNRMLETNVTPVLWITNDVSSMDTAHLRRFDLILEMVSPGVSHRRRMARQALGELPITVDHLERIAASKIPPASLMRAGEVLRLMHTDARLPALEIPLDAWLDEHLRVQGEPGLEPPRDDGLFDDAEMDVALDPGEAAPRLTGSANLRVLVEGPAGSGHRSWIRRLARQREQDVLRLAAADVVLGLISGDTDLIDRVSNAARRARAMLVIEDVDLLSPSGDLLSPVLAEVLRHRLNGLLSRSDLCLLISTTTPDRIDPVWRQQMDLQVRLRPLTTVRAEALLARMADAAGFPQTEADEEVLRLPPDLQVLEADLHKVKRRHTLIPLRSRAAWREVLLDVTPRRQTAEGIGFIRTSTNKT